ncbi:MAG: TIGR02584 family CRISPR-associated protein [Sphingomonadales bacterium]|nr:MAG: TIGR02584 family CRISPR-associated protein [Sphingomonadales bacterium]
MGANIVHLLALVGLAPAVVAETAWALTRAGCTFNGVTLVTTVAGAQRARATLTGPEGAIARMLRPAAAPPIHLEIIARDGQPIDDIREPHDHHALVAVLDRLLRELTAPDRPPLHASLAGGRKTMAAALGLAMSVHARAQDRLSHVLVAPPYDSDPDFLFPAPGDEAAAGAMALIDIPFARLRPLLPEGVVAATVNNIGAAQARLDATTPLVLDLAHQCLRLGTTSLRLTPIHAALLGLLAEASANGGSGVSALDLDVVRLMKLYGISGGGAATPALAARLHRDGCDAWLREHLSRLRRVLQPMAGSIGIVRLGARPQSRYHLIGAPVVLNTPVPDITTMMEPL